MIQLRWLVIPGPTEHSQPRLQYRTLNGYMDASGALNIAQAEWGPWLDVPEVAVPVITNVATTPTAGEKP